jgi:2,4-dienoyl-CoA reductase-like NADH-dependent reductase (Old Yellow Enzyme family)
VSFGRLYVTNPDLVERFQQGLELRSMSNVKDPALLKEYLYGLGPEGYVDVSVFEK